MVFELFEGNVYGYAAASHFGHISELSMRLILPRTIILTSLLVGITIIAAPMNAVHAFAIQFQYPSLIQAGQQTDVAVSSPTPEVAHDGHKIIESGEKVVTAFGILLGGFWAWLKFFRGRTFRSRLELTLTGKIIMRGTTGFLKANMGMKNVGLSQLKLKQDAIYLDVFLIEAANVRPAQQLYSAMWSEPATFEVFKDHGWIESGEEIKDELLFQLPDNEQLACKLKLTVNSRGTFLRTEGTRWSSTAIVDCLRPALKES